MAQRFGVLRNAVTLTADGVQLTAEQGEPLAHALIAAGRTPMVRSPKLRRPRGPWCLRGGCDGCLARVDGVPGVMTCMVPVRGGERVESQAGSGPADVSIEAATAWIFPEGFDHHRLLASYPGGARALSAVARRLAGAGALPEQAAALSPVRRLNTEVLVIGGGLAGRSVASILAGRGAQVVLVDDGPCEGGCLASLGVQERERWLASASVADATVHGLSTAAGIFGEQVLVVTPAETVVYRPSAVVIAAGAHDVGPLLAGNDLRGVMSARAVARLAASGISAGEPVAIVGGGVFCERVEALLQGHADTRRVTGQVAGFAGRGKLAAVVLQDGTQVPAEVAAVGGVPAPAHELALQAGATVELTGSGYVPRSDEAGRVAAAVWCAGECAGLAFEPERLIAQAQEVAASVLSHLA
jgi:sarcosine oxidase subunit alpha